MHPTTYLGALSIREDFTNSLTYSSLDIKICMMGYDGLSAFYVYVSVA